MARAKGGRCPQGSMNAGLSQLGSQKSTCKDLGAESSCTTPLSWFNPIQQLSGRGEMVGKCPCWAFPGVACPFRIRGHYGWRAGIESRSLSAPAPTSPFGNPFRNASCLLNQIPSVFQVLLLTAGSKASQTCSTLNAFVPGASCQPESGRADRA